MKLTLTMPERPVWGYSNDDAHQVNQAFFNYQFMLIENFDIPSVRKAMKEGTFYFSYEYGGTGNAMAPKINENRVDQETGSMHAPEFAKSMRKGTSGVNRWICILRKPSLP